MNLDLSEIIQEAIRERQEATRLRNRRIEIEAQIEQLKAELETLPGQGWFIPQWRMKLDQAIDAAIEQELNNQKQ